VNDRLTINPGLRFDRGRQASRRPGDLQQRQHAPRLGFAFDVTGDHKTVVKGSYSQYYEGSSTTSQAHARHVRQRGHDASACPSINPQDICGLDNLTEIDRTPATLYTIDPT
jgi:hypothetical protein